MVIPLAELGKWIWMEWKSRLLFGTVKAGMAIRHPNRVVQWGVRQTRKSQIEILHALVFRCYLKL